MLFYATFKRWIQALNHQLINSVAKDEQCNTDHEAADAPQQAQHYWNNADQLEFSDQSLKPSFNPSRGHGHPPQQLVLKVSARSLVLLETQNEALYKSRLRRALIIKIAKTALFACSASYKHWMLLGLV